MANANGGGYSSDKTALLFVDPNNDFHSGGASEMGWRLIDTLRTKLWNEEISK
jgi:hypothetical protein